MDKTCGRLQAIKSRSIISEVVKIWNLNNNCFSTVIFCMRIYKAKWNRLQWIRKHQHLSIFYVIQFSLPVYYFYLQFPILSIWLAICSIYIASCPNHHRIQLTKKTKDQTFGARYFFDDHFR